MENNKLQEILTNLETVLMNTKFLPQEFEAALDMVNFISNLKKEVEAKNAQTAQTESV